MLNVSFMLLCFVVVKGLINIKITTIRRRSTRTDGDIAQSWSKRDTSYAVKLYNLHSLSINII